MTQLGYKHPFTSMLVSLAASARIQHTNISLAADKLAALSWEERQHVASEVMWGQLNLEVAVQQLLRNECISQVAALKAVTMLGYQHPFTAKLVSLVSTAQEQQQRARSGISLAADKLAALSWEERQHVASEVVWGQHNLEVAVQQLLRSECITQVAALKAVTMLGYQHPFTAKLVSLVAGKATMAGSKRTATEELAEQQRQRAEGFSKRPSRRSASALPPPAPPQSRPPQVSAQLEMPSRPSATASTAALPDSVQDKASSGEQETTAVPNPTLQQAVGTTGSIMQQQLVQAAPLAPEWGNPQQMMPAGPPRGTFSAPPWPFHRSQASHQRHMAHIQRRAGMLQPPAVPLSWLLARQSMRAMSD